MSESGLRSTIGNRVYAKSVSGVRIPISPPDYSGGTFYGNAFFVGRHKYPADPPHAEGWQSG